MQEERVIFLSDTFEVHPKKLIISFENALSVGKALNMTDPLNLSHHFHKTVIDNDRVVLSPLERHEITYVDMTAKSNGFIADGMFEPQYHTYRDNHHCQSYRYT